ncbi:2-dehydropantoate 2-reductase domain protein [Burkholderia pseudomallei]|nr:2-dehydropantoate 2-reductase domain protein [Burkholderia pseudomallei]
MPRPRTTTPGSRVADDRCTTQPIARAGGSAAAVTPPGSTASSAAPSSGPPKPSKNHHGRPFIAATMIVRGPTSGAMREASAGSACAFNATTT